MRQVLRRGVGHNTLPPLNFDRRPQRNAPDFCTQVSPLTKSAKCALDQCLGWLSGEASGYVPLAIRPSARFGARSRSSRQCTTCSLNPSRKSVPRGGAGGLVGESDAAEHEIDRAA